VKPLFFPSPAEWRRWLASHHKSAGELRVGFYKRESGKPSLTWAEAVDEALCYGWIDGVRKRINGHSYTIRFTPRRRTSTWSAVNVRRVKELIRRGRMRTAGTRAYLARSQANTGIYSFEQRRVVLPSVLQRQFKASTAAWRFFQSQAPWYQRAAIWWVVSAKREETRRRRLAVLIDDSGHARTIRPLTRWK
jgi:uncharacterized protein YdeI (YjbR/CyaY-like superfamily)